MFERWLNSLSPAMFVAFTCACGAVTSLLFSVLAIYALDRGGALARPAVLAIIAVSAVGQVALGVRLVRLHRRCR